MLHDLEHAVRHGLKVDQIAAAPRSGAQAQTACGGASLATIRRLTLSLLREDTSLKRSVKAKRFACVLDLNDLLQVFQQAQIDAQTLDSAVSINTRAFRSTVCGQLWSKRR